MKKILLLLCLLLITGCTQSKVNQEEINPIGDKTSLDEINEITHGRITKPGVMGISDEKYSIIDADGEGIISQYSFTLNDNEYIVRFSSNMANKDVSGVTIDGKDAFEEDYNDVRAVGDGVKLARWFTTDGQYVLIAPSDIDDDLYNSITNEIASLTVPKEQ